MEKLCKNCIYWDLDTKETWEPGEYEKSFEPEPNTVIVAECNSPKKQQTYHIPYDGWTSNMIWVEDDEGWGFRSGPDFGCVNWEAKEIKE